MTRAERRSEKKKYGKDFANFCRIMKLYFPDFISWLVGLKDPRKFWTYEIEVMLMTVIMKNICCISSMQQMTDEFTKDECVKNLCTVPGVPEHEFLPHYVAVNEFLSKMDTEELEKLCRRMIHALLRRRKFEDAKLLNKYWMAIFDAAGLFHFKERHCPHKKMSRQFITFMSWKRRSYLGTALRPVPARNLLKMKTKMFPKMTVKPKRSDGLQSG